MSRPAANEHLSYSPLSAPWIAAGTAILKILIRKFPARKQLILRSDFANLPNHPHAVPVEKTQVAKVPASRHRSRRAARVQVRNSTWDKTLDGGSFDRNHWQEPDQRSDGAIVLKNGENHYGMRFVRSNPLAIKSSFLAVLVLALVLGSERACAEPLSSAPYAADAHDQICNCGTRCQHESCCCGRGLATRGGSEESEPGSFPQGERRLGPCLGDAPCGDPGLPSSTPPSSTGRAAALALTAGIQPATPGDLLASPQSCGHRPHWSSRIDRPPRACRCA